MCAETFTYEILSSALDHILVSAGSLCSAGIC